MERLLGVYRAGDPHAAPELAPGLHTAAYTGAVWGEVEEDHSFACLALERIPLHTAPGV